MESSSNLSGGGLGSLPSSWLTAGFVAEAIIIYLVSFPSGMTFSQFAFNDFGANLTAEHLIRHGYRPGVDFGLNRGLLSLLLAHAWFTFFGLKPISFLLAMPIFDVLIAWGFARFITRLKLSIAGIAVIFAAAPFAICGVWGDLAHPLDAALLSHALAEHAAGKRGRALALATAALFALPAMGYIYGLLLLIFIFRELKRREQLNFSRVLTTIAPAALTGIALIGILTMAFGLPSVVAQMFPITGMRNFAIQHRGLFTGYDRGFLYSRNIRITYYVGTVVTFWVCATLWLLVSGVRAGLSFWKSTVRTGLEINYEVVFCIAVMHLSFVIGFFDGTWTDAYMLIMAVGATSVWDWSSMTSVWVLVPIAVMGNASMLVTSYRVLVHMDMRPETAGLWAPLDQQREWTHVLQIVRGHRPVLVENDGAADLLFPEFESPTNFSLIPGQVKVSELQRKVQQLSRAEMAVTVNLPGLPSPEPLVLFPQLRNALEGCDLVWKGTFATVYRRKSTANPVDASVDNHVIVQSRIAAVRR